MSDDTPGSMRPVRLLSRDRMSRTVIASAFGMACLTLIGLALIASGAPSETTIMGIVGAISTCVGYVAGRQSAPGSST